MLIDGKIVYRNENGGRQSKIMFSRNRIRIYAINKFIIAFRILRK